jgi:hypothetical protein
MNLYKVSYQNISGLTEVLYVAAEDMREIFTVLPNLSENIRTIEYVCDMDRVINMPTENQ